VSFFVEHIERRNLPYYQLKQTLFVMFERWRPARVWRVVVARYRTNRRREADEYTADHTGQGNALEGRSRTGRRRAVRGGQGQIRMDAPWHGDLLSEFLAFPNGRNGDIVDAVCTGLAILRESTAPAPMTIRCFHISALDTKEPRAVERDARYQLLRPAFLRI
jgi:hypothetical protein